MTAAKIGDSVVIHYHGTLEDGEVFDSSLEREPFEFTLGEGQVIPGFEQAVDGMKVGDKKEISIPPDEAYGDLNDQLVVEVPKTNLPEGAEPGMAFQVTLPNGQLHPFQLVELQDEVAIMDGNHPLAGQTLNFNLELVDIKA